MQVRALALVVCATAVTSAMALAQRTEKLVDGEWHYYAADAHATKYSAVAQIDKTNLNQLAVAWMWESADRALQLSNPVWRASRNEDTPLYARGALYTVTPLSLVASIDPATGATRWVYDPESYKAGRPTNVGFTNRGLAYWSDGSAERLFVSTPDAYLISVDAKTGKPDAAFGVGGKVDLVKDVPKAQRAVNFAGRRPLVAGDVVIVGNTVSDGALNMDSNPPGYVFAFDVRTGKQLWTFHTVPKKGEFGYETWLEGSADYSGNTNVWGGMAYDDALGYAYMASSTPTNDYYGGHRPGDNLFAESIVCVEAKTGKRVWHFQGVHHGLWDYDFPADPILGDITVNGRRIPAVMQVSKQAFTYALDRRTGKPVWPIEERKVPQSTVPRERTSPTQPFPTKPPAFDLQGTTEENLIDFTPELKKLALEKLQQFDHGPVFTPPSLKGTITLPGMFGGANWGGAGFDPETGMLYVPSRMFPSVHRVSPGDPARTNLLYRNGGTGPRVEDATIDGLPIFKPPYSRITALDMNRGERRWMAPLGNGPRQHPLLKGVVVGPLGDQIHGGSVLITKTLLFVSVTHLQYDGRPSPPAWAKWGDSNAQRKALFVFDKNTGELLRTIEIDGMGAAAPMTYLHQGKQYIVLAVGGGEDVKLVALTLQPETNAVVSSGPAK